VSLTKRILIGLTILLLVVVGAAAWMFRSRAEAIPDQLAPIDTAEADPSKIVIPGRGGLPDLVLADLRGKTVYLLVGDRESSQARESMLFDRALGRWDIPQDVVGFSIADTEGLRYLASVIEGFIDPMRPELRLPLHIDYDGAITRAFKLPKGHAGVVVLGPGGEILMRHSGPPPAGPEGDKVIEQLRTHLKAKEPTLAPAPAFKLGTLDNTACKGKVCIFVFLARPVKKTDLPGVEGGFDGDTDAMWKQLGDPSVRLASLVHDSDTKLVAADEKAAKADKPATPPAPRVEAVLVGALADVELKRWTTVPAAPEARAALQIPEDQAGVVIIDADGNLAVREVGVVRMYKFTRISELLGVDLSDRRE
jgi:hypothetical protein